MIEALLVLALAVFVLFASACRLGAMQILRFRTDWNLIYLLFAAYAFGEGLNACRTLAGGGEIPDLAAVALAGMAMMLWSSRHTWTNGPPKHMRVTDAPAK